ncbi:MAG TPA: terpene synthase family protein [Polyangium sp.]|nr:terpene synthase family protein [Polyangium sp.]
MKNQKSWPDRSGETIAIRMASDVAADTPRLDLPLRIPAHWRPEPLVNVHAVDIEAPLLAWFCEMGFGARHLEMLRTFAPGQYAGAPFPHATRRELLCIAKYLSLWLLWDDEDVESNGRGFNLRPYQIFHASAKPPTNIFDKAWWNLFCELAQVHSRNWIEMLVEAMHMWSVAALAEARQVQSWNSEQRHVRFSDAMQSRIATIGMYATAHLLEHARHIELPRIIHQHPTVRRIKMLANKIVGLGNDLLSLGKDLARDYVNVIVVLADEYALSLQEAIRRSTRMHDDALLEFDRLAASLPSFGPEHDGAIAVWLDDLRYSCLGFVMWEARAPRYAAFKVLVDGAVLEPRFVFRSHSSSAAVRAMANPVG